MFAIHISSRGLPRDFKDVFSGNNSLSLGEILQEKNMCAESSGDIFTAD